MHRAAVAATIALALIERSASAQSGNRWADEAQRRLSHAAKTISDKGYGQAQETQIGSLAAHETESFTLTLHGGTAYALVGVCDSDCKDLDLVLYDADGNQVDADIQNDEYPLVQVTPSETQRYRVNVIMADCRTNPCWYGIGVYGK